MSEEPEKDRLMLLVEQFAGKVTDLANEIEKISPKKLQDLLGDNYEKACDWIELVNMQLGAAVKMFKVGAVGMVLGRLKKFIERNKDDE